MSKIAELLRVENDAELREMRGHYKELLLRDSDSDADLLELKVLMVALGKSPADVVADQQALQAIAKHRATLKAARDNHRRIAPAEKAMEEHEAETARLLQARGQAAATLQEALHQVYGPRAAGEDARDAINTLRTDPRFVELLKSEPEATDADLKPAA